MRRLMMKLLLCAAAILLPQAALAQWPPEKLKNLKVLPPDITVRALVDTMAGFTRALGVRCSFCHVGKESEPLDKYDFASDDKSEKMKAREMLRMVTAINSEHLAKLVSRRNPKIVVACATCHHGISQPRPLQQVLLMAYDAGGADSVESAYRALRTRYYGAAAYDFGEVPLVDVGNALHARTQEADALRIYKFNTEVSPTSTFAFRSVAGAQLSAGDTAGAVASFQRALSINPNDQQSKDAIDRLHPKPFK